ncbi:hypothetical protein LUZ63_013333 [Rhynchospora breviuscula]|uniref:serine C-palmitoyltransferase n=1 Tax=Rhynchospora breviuscula TaxID=2022672 RepID=A0A9Q0C8F7_9POAL|nr:hypothetical protein LUZ63_013333 [Rhynchospora breviuscula]
MRKWDHWVDAALVNLLARRLDKFSKPVWLDMSCNDGEVESFSEPGPWDRSAVVIKMEGPSLSKWLSYLPKMGNKTSTKFLNDRQNMLLFSGNDYLCLSSHPAVRKAASSASLEHGMGPRGSVLVCGNTSYHESVASTLATLTKKEACVLCPTGFAANVAFLVTVGNIISLLSTSKKKPPVHEQVAIFSDEFNHASIIDGIRTAEKHGEARLFFYRHCDVSHLEHLLSTCSMEKKLVITDSLFSMDGDFAPLPELAALRQKHGFLLAIDDAHGTLVCGENGGGVAEWYGCENDVDIVIGCISKAIGTLGGFIACSNKWKQLIESRGRSFIYTTTIPVPIVAASNAALMVAKKEKWRKETLWKRVNDFRKLTGLDIKSPIISVVVGDEKTALSACRHLLISGFFIVSVLPPIVPPNSCRLRITLTCAHTTEDIRRLVEALLPFIKSLQTVSSKM